MTLAIEPFEATTGIRSYSSPLAVGHKAATALFHGPVVVQEKIDGSQFSFLLTETDELLFRSRGQQIVVDGPTNMFAAGIAAIQERRHLLHQGWLYRGEYLQKPKHNALAYSRIPNGHVILFDVAVGDQDYLSPAALQAEAAKINLECVPVLFEGVITSAEQVKALMPATSILGGVAEGLVVKNYSQFTVDKKTLMGKYVTDTFKETHRKTWGESNPGKGDIVRTLVSELHSPARWQKAIQHLREAGTLTDSPKDIGPLLKEIQADIRNEESDYIKEKLFQFAWPHIARGVIANFPEWYKEQLLGEAFPAVDPLDEPMAA